MKSNEQLRKEFEEQTGNKAIVFPACHGETGYASWEYQLWLEQKLLEEYAQQSQPSPAGAAEGAPSDNAFMNGGNTESEKSFYAMGYMDRKKASEGMAEALRLKWITLTEDMGRMLSGQRGVSIDKLNKVMNLVQEFVNTLPASLSSPGSGWVKVEDGLPEVLETVWISNGKGWTTLGCRSDYQQGDDGELIWCWCATNGTIYEEDGKIVAECEEDDWDVRHWQPLPTPPGVEDKANGK